ncbi:MAG: NADH-quinone oxidoreductase subunit L [Limisphaerales bacterium]
MYDPLPWMVLFVPLLAAVVITLFTQKNPRFSAVLSVGAVLISFLLSLNLFCNSMALTTILAIGPFSLPPEDISVSWLKVGHLSIHFGMHFDPLSLLMLLIVTGVGSAIHIYSIGYMKGDPGESRFFAELSLFTFAMLGVVLSDNFLEMFIFWELVGLSSYLLIGFWYERASAADAAKKAFLTNRLGDFGFFTGILLVWAVTGTLNFAAVHTQMINNPELFDTAATLVGLLIFCGAVGKSAQFPLHVWLPDAMEGPTPVSALIHAATMVAAGVYMLCRVFFIFDPSALHVIAFIGGFTALMSALVACQQDDIKRILAYSTLSQLGYMVMAVGLSHPPAAMFHLATHAFFKALLFLGAGSVIHAVSQEQNIWKMGRLREKMPVTYWTFLAATLAICGCPFFSGFYSKDAILSAAYNGSLDSLLSKDFLLSADYNGILTAAYNGSMTAFAVGVLVAFLTTFYMFRLFFVVFLGKAKSDLPAHAHESPKVMTWPLMVLAIGAVFGGFFGIEQFIAPQFGEKAPEVFAPLEPFRTATVPAWLGVAAFAVGLWLAFHFYYRAESDPLPARLRSLSRILRHKFYFDEMYASLIAMTQDLVARFANGFDIGLQWLVRFVQGTTELTGRGLRLIQTGNLQTYTFLFAAGIALALYLMLLR